MTIDDLIEEFTRLEKLDPWARLDWNSTGDAHVIRVAAFGSAYTFGIFRTLMEDAGQLIAITEDNPGRTAHERFIVAVFQTVPELKEHCPHMPNYWSAIETDHDGTSHTVQCAGRMIPHAARACVLALRRLREFITPKLAKKRFNLTEEVQKCFALQSRTTKPKHSGRKRGMAKNFKLTPKQEEAMKLRAKNMTLMQIALAMGHKSTSAVRNILKRGKENVRHIEAISGGGGRSVGKRSPLNEHLIVDGKGAGGTPARHRTSA